jgi:N-methylhydantoinase A/oxoprolinase/acetone carboxylase beta subunit
MPYRPDSGAILARKRRRVLVAAGEWVEATILRRVELSRGFTVHGPAVIEEADSTTFVPPGFVARVDSTWCLIIEREAAV